MARKRLGKRERAARKRQKRNVCRYSNSTMSGWLTYKLGSRKRQKFNPFKALSKNVIVVDDAEK